MKYWLIGLLLSLVFLGTSCQKKEYSKHQITGKEWRLIKWSHHELNPVDYTITASFTKDTVSGKSAVNQYNGPYTINDSNELTIGAVVTTRMAGSPEEMKAEQIYHDLLSKVKKFEIDDTGLILISEIGTNLLQFVSY